jgi:hypothetical protein
MEAWLAMHGKGPLTIEEMQTLEGLPGCLPEEVETVEGAHGYVSSLLQDRHNQIPPFTNKVKGSTEWAKIVEIGQGLSVKAGEMPALKDAELQASREVVCPYILEGTHILCKRCPRPDHIGEEGEEAVTFDPEPAKIKRRGAERWYYFAGYSQNRYFAAPDASGESKAGWYVWDDYIKRVELVIESVAIVSGDVTLHSTNAADILAYRENLLSAFVEGRAISTNFDYLIAKEYSRVSKEAFNKYSGSGHLDPIYPIYEVLGLFTGKQLVRGVVKFGSALRALRNAKSVVNYSFSDDALKIFTKKGDEVGKVIDGKIQPVRFIVEGEEIAEVGGQKLLKQGDEVGFKATGKVFDAPEFAEYIKGIKTRNPAGAPGSGARVYQERVAGSLEYEIKGGASKVWADGVEKVSGKVKEAKFISKPGSSPFIEGSSIPDPIRKKIVDEIRDEFRRYGNVIKDPNAPLIELEVLVNDSGAVAFFESLMKEFGIPGKVVVQP